jgi:hypothetical protein
VTYDGAGFDPQRRAYGTGLPGMADWLQPHGGSLTIGSSPGAGTTISAGSPAGCLRRPGDHRRGPLDGEGRLAAGGRGAGGRGRPANLTHHARLRERPKAGRSAESGQSGTLAAAVRVHQA